VLIQGYCLSSSPTQWKPGEQLGRFKGVVVLSGVRHRQHPDRGDGAVNASDEEVLEDLHISNWQGILV